MASGWYYKGNCLDAIGLRDSVYSELPIPVSNSSQLYYLTYITSYNFDQSTSTLKVSYTTRISNNSVYNGLDTTSLRLNTCEIESNSGVFSSLPVQDILIPLAMLFLFFMGFAQGRK